VNDDDQLRNLSAEVLLRTGARDLAEARGSAALAGLEPDLRAVLRLRLGLDRDPIRPRTRGEVAETMGMGGPRIAEGLAAIERDALDALGGSPAGPPAAGPAS
jgi:hypothetical protein